MYNLKLRCQNFAAILLLHKPRDAREFLKFYIIFSSKNLIFWRDNIFLLADFKVIFEKILIKFTGSEWGEHFNLVRVFN